MLRLRRLAPESLARNFDQLAALLLLNLLVWAVLDTLHAENGAQLMLDGLYGWAFYLLLGLFGCGLVARAYCRQADTRSLLIAVLAVAPYVLAVFWLLGDLTLVDDRPRTSLILATLYLIVLSVRVLQAAYGSVRPKAVVAAMVFILLAPFVLASVNIDTRLWLTDEVEDTESDDTGGTESILYDQPARIVAAVDQMEPRDPGRSNVFYVGFAGDGEQSIFKREALFGENVLGAHFSSAQRSLELINDPDDRDSYPIASLSALQQTLKLTASRMDLGRDVLVLLLTSHGSQDGLAVSNGSLPLEQLAPADLARALEDSGIKWRVVIVSACYSGVFVDALKGPETLVITAADADHSSFGCDDDRELTYFGEAFLKDSVPATPSLEEAFKKASDLIQKRETAEHKTRSNPQMVEGDLLREKLAEIEGAGHVPGHGTIVANH